jgi:hypothetical protein
MPTYVFGLSDVKIYTGWSATAGTYDQVAEIESAQMLVTDLVMQQAQLEGDDHITDIVSRVTSVSFRVRFGFRDLDVISLITGATLAESDTFDSLTFGRDTLSEFSLWGMADGTGESGQHLEIWIPRCKLLDGFGVTMEKGTYVTPELEGVGLYDIEEETAMTMRQMLTLGVPVGGGGGLAALRATFSGAGDTVALFREDVSGDAIDPSYYLAQHIGDQRYWCIELKQIEDAGGRTISSWRRGQIRRPVLSVSQDDAAVTLSGTWVSANDAGAYGGNYARSATTTDYAEYTTPADTISVGVFTYPVTNAGLALVSIDGDTTTATNLPTAQDVVDDGTFPDSILIANGGTLNPTDRVLDGYAIGTYVQKHYPLILADDLTPGAHTVRLTVTGYKRAASSDVRVYVCGLCYRLSTTQLTDANAMLAVLLNLDTGLSAFEYAFNINGGSSSVFVGNCAHGYDGESEIVYKVDGVTQAPDNFDYIAGSLITVNRLSNLYHPDIDGGTTPVASVDLTYTVHPTSGITVTHTITWLANVSGTNCYPHMFPLSGAVFTKGGNFDAATADVLLDSDDSSRVCNAPSRAVYAWQTGGHYAALLSIDNLIPVNDWLDSGGVTFWIEDRTGGSINKIYLTRIGATSKNIANTETWQGNANYRVAYLDDPDATLAKA